MNEENKIIYTFCWFDEEQWNSLSKLDPNGVDDSYSKWRNNANKAITELEDNGQSVKKISIKTSELEKWCKERNQEPNGKSRSEYAASLAQARNAKR
jgi:hypothetical protein